MSESPCDVGFKVLVCGSRDWEDGTRIKQQINALLAEHGNGLTMIAGGARGADSIAAAYAKTLGMNLIEVRAQWSKYGKRAGYVRNVLMLDMAPDLVLAFWDGRSPGTKNTITEARKRSIPVLIVEPAMVA